jgi:hypothetical protein
MELVGARGSGLRWHIISRLIYIVSSAGSRGIVHPSIILVALYIILCLPSASSKALYIISRQIYITAGPTHIDQAENYMGTMLQSVGRNRRHIILPENYMWNPDGTTSASQSYMGRGQDYRGMARPPASASPVYIDGALE